MLRMLLVVLLALPASLVAADDAIVKKLQDVSVTIRTSGGQGSGVIFTRKDANGTKSYVWTAAHVLDALRKTRVVIVDGSPRTVVEFGDAEVVQEFREDGRRIGEQKMDARVIRYSDADQGHDLALLEVRKKNFVPAEVTVEFYDGEIPALGTELYHVGSLLGQFGSNSLTVGVVSQVGRVLDLGANGIVFDQTSATAFPGSSGGGVFLKADGKYMGMLVRGSGEQFNFIVPVRRMRQWAKDAKVEWAMDAAVEMPSTSDLAKLPVEDAGVVFGGESEGAKRYPYLLLKPETRQ